MEDMALVYNINLCRICQIPSNLDLVNTSTIAQNGETYLNILKNIFDDIIWVEDQLISLACRTCLSKISQIAEFKKICFETNNRRGLLFFDCIKLEDAGQLKDNDVSCSLEKDLQISGNERFINLKIGVGRKRTAVTVSKNLRPRIKFRKKDKESQVQFNDDEGMEIDKIEDVGGLFQSCGEKSETLEYVDNIQLQNENGISSEKENRLVKTKQKENNDKSKSGFNNRVKRQNKSGQKCTLGIVCDICEQRCVSIAERDRHIYKEHNGARSYICSICERGYITKDDLSNHLKAVHANKEQYKFLCTECRAKFYKSSALQKHKEARHNLKENCTLLSDDEFATSVELNNMLKHTIADEQSQTDRKDEEISIDDGIIKREELNCEKQFAKAKTKNNDVRIKNKPKSRSKTGRTRTLGIVCDICQIPCISIAERDRHICSQHNGARKHICAICGRCYITKDDLSGHIKAVHSDKEQYKFLCTECGAKFYKLSVLKKHTETRHKHSRKYSCTLCDNKFTTNGNLKSHLLTHTNVRQFKCELCPAEYKRKDIYLIHQTQKHGIGNYKCNRNLKDKNHGCSMCDQRFNTRPRLLVHIKKHHTDVEPFCKKELDKLF